MSGKPLTCRKKKNTPCHQFKSPILQEKRRLGNPGVCILHMR